MWPADRLAAAAGARLTGPAVTFTSVSTDTRTIQPGALYVALRGENFDGHAFIDAALAAGAAGVLVSREVAVPPAVTVLSCTDTLLALQLMGSAARRTIAGPVIAVTGSNGKTSTRQLIASILTAHYGESCVLSTQGNYNNHIGVPLTLLRAAPTHRAAVIEAGMNHFHELSLLSSLIQPDVAVITNAGPAHLEGVGSLAGVAQAKAEIFDCLRHSGTAVLNADDYFLPFWEVVNRNRTVMRFGFGDRADVQGEFNAADSSLSVTRGLAATLRVKLPFSGEHNGRNALSAVAVAKVLDIPSEAIRTGLEAATNIGGRLTRRQLRDSLHVIDDSYNANPASVRAGLSVLVNEPGQKILVLGDMAELGTESDALHQQVLVDAQRSSVDHILTLGTRMQRAAAAIGGRTVTFIELDELVQALRSRLERPTTVLVKGAHSMAMHRVIDRLATQLGEQK
jgi:UDP-N-acetylmuramoyl-tripeptide--D-alanyl-D-alanine ligase